MRSVLSHFSFPSRNFARSALILPLQDDTMIPTLPPTPESSGCRPLYDSPLNQPDPSSCDSHTSINTEVYVDKSSLAIGFTIQIEVCTQPCAAPSSIERLGQHPKPFQYIPMAIFIHGTLTNKCRDLIDLVIYGAFSLGRISANNGCQVTEELLTLSAKLRECPTLNHYMMGHSKSLSSLNGVLFWMTSCRRTSR